MTAEWNSWKRAKEGTWCCRYCSVIFPTRNKLLEHYHTHSEYKRIERRNNDWCCKYCNEKFKTRKLLFLHLKVCEEKLKLPHDSAGRVILEERTKKGVETRRQLFLSGKLHTTKGKSLSEEHKAAISKGTKEYLQDITCGGVRFSIKACSFIDNLNKQNVWNLQHALNGGEITCGPYYIDGYDKDLNIAFEYDEPKHHYGYNDTLSEHDIIKMQYIKEKLNCRFFRYNEKLDQLYEC